MEDPRMRQEFQRKVKILKQKKAHSEKKHISCIDANRDMVHNWLENKQSRQQQIHYANAQRLTICKKRRELSLETKRQKDLKHLAHWDDFRERRTIAIANYLRAKQRQRRCNTLVKHAKAFLAIQRIYKVFRVEKLKAVDKARRAWSHWKIAYHFAVYMKKRFAPFERTLNDRNLKRTRW